MPIIDEVREFWQGKTNSSRNSKKLKAELEKRGHTDVHVWWETIGPAFEMCGHSGGYFAASEQIHDVIEALGLDLAEAMEHVQTSPWLQKA